MKIYKIKIEQNKKYKFNNENNLKEFKEFLRILNAVGNFYKYREDAKYRIKINKDVFCDSDKYSFKIEEIDLIE